MSAIPLYHDSTHHSGISDDQADAERRARRMVKDATATYVSAMQNAQALCGITAVQEQLDQLLAAISDNTPSDTAWQEAIAEARGG